MTEFYEYLFAMETSGEVFLFFALIGAVAFVAGIGWHAAAVGLGRK